MKNSIKFKTYLIGFILSCLVTFLFIKSYTDGMNTGNNNKNIKGTITYNSIKELVESTSFNIIIPNYITDNFKDNELNIEKTMGQIIQINSNTFVYKAMTFVNNNADPLGLYNKSETDNMYNVNNNTDILFFRYRLGYEEYPHCTIINWCDSNMAYGIMIENIMTEDEALNLLEIDKQSLTETTPEENNGIIKEDNTNEYIEYTIGDIGNIQIPKFISETNIIENNGYIMFYIDKKLIFVIIYNEYDIDNDTFSGESEIEIKDDIIMKYLSNNPFNNDTNAYKDYNKFINTIDIIIDSFTYN